MRKSDIRREKNRLDRTQASLTSMINVEPAGLNKTVMQDALDDVNLAIAHLTTLL